MTIAGTLLAREEDVNLSLSAVVPKQLSCCVRRQHGYGLLCVLLLLPMLVLQVIGGVTVKEMNSYCPINIHTIDEEKFKHSPIPPLRYSGFQPTKYGPVVEIDLSSIPQYDWTEKALQAKLYFYAKTVDGGKLIDHFDLYLQDLYYGRQFPYLFFESIIDSVYKKLLSSTSSKAAIFKTVSEEHSIGISDNLRDNDVFDVLHSLNESESGWSVCPLFHAKYGRFLCNNLIRLENFLIGIRHPGGMIEAKRMRATLWVTLRKGEDPVHRGASFVYGSDSSWIISLTPRQCQDVAKAVSSQLRLNVLHDGDTSYWHIDITHNDFNNFRGSQASIPQSLMGLGQRVNLLMDYVVNPAPPFP
eukprot:GHVS01061125.1.p1 GENE.GHVS01061125.1~~GHVS01061125.1.p1  ORF type:complete len:358 (-),score=5.55 GHVS01061125.1:145-1218(-)